MLPSVSKPIGNFKDEGQCAFLCVALGRKWRVIVVKTARWELSSLQEGRWWDKLVQLWLADGRPLRLWPELCGSVYLFVTALFSSLWANLSSTHFPRPRPSQEVELNRQTPRQGWLERLFQHRLPEKYRPCSKVSFLYSHVGWDFSQPSDVCRNPVCQISQISDFTKTVLFITRPCWWNTYCRSNTNKENHMQAHIFMWINS